jgi:hypothetical protein
MHYMYSIMYPELGQHGWYRLGYGLENWWTKVLFLVQATRFFSSKHPDWLWGPVSCSVGAGDSVPRFEDMQPPVYFPICASSPLVAIVDISKHSDIWRSCSRIFYNPFTRSVNWKDKSNFCICQRHMGDLNLDTIWSCMASVTLW